MSPTAIFFGFLAIGALQASKIIMDGLKKRHDELVEEDKRNGTFKHRPMCTYPKD